MNTVDPRVTRTRKLLTDALMNIIVEQGYNEITVRSIVQRAGVNRSTFYLHFQDKQDIITTMEERILGELAACVRNPSFTYETALREYNNLNRPIHSAVALFDHIERYAPLYRKVLFESNFRARVTEVIRRELLMFSQSSLDLAFAANGIVGVILYWLQSGMTESVTDMSMWLTRFAFQPLR